MRTRAVVVVHFFMEHFLYRMNVNGKELERDELHRDEHSGTLLLLRDQFGWREMLCRQRAQIRYVVQRYTMNLNE